MSFFKDFKADFAQAVNELIPDSEEMTTEYDDDDMVNTFDEEPEKEAEPKKSKKKSKFFGAFAAEDAAPAASEEDFEIAPEDLIEDIDDIEQTDEMKQTDAEQTDAQEKLQSGGIGIREDGEAQMSFDFLANAMNMTEDIQVDDAPVVEERFEETEEIDKTYFASEKDSEAEAATDAYSEAAELDGDVEDVLSHTGDTDVITNAIHSETSDDEEASTEEIPDATQMQPADEDRKQHDTFGFTEETEDAGEDCYVDTFTQTSEQSPEDISETAKEIESSDTIKEEAAMIQVEEEKTVSEETAAEYDDATTYITKSTKLTGDIETDGSIDIIGEVVGNVTCKGKLVAGGVIRGNVFANEVYANAARIEGDVNCEGSAKIGVGSVVIGKVEATSAVVAGAVNGDIDVHGPVIVDSTAVIMGNIKSRSVQINNGAVIEGFCSQCYSEIDVKSFFA